MLIGQIIDQPFANFCAACSFTADEISRQEDSIDAVRRESDDPVPDLQTYIELTKPYAKWPYVLSVRRRQPGNFLVRYPNLEALFSQSLCRFVQCRACGFDCFSPSRSITPEMAMVQAGAPRA